MKKILYKAGMNWLYKFFDNLNQSTDQSIEHFCQVEYGKNWKYALDFYNKNKSFPRLK